MGCYLELANIDLTQCCMKQVKRAPYKSARADYRILCEEVKAIEQCKCYLQGEYWVARYKTLCRVGGRTAR